MRTIIRRTSQVTRRNSPNILAALGASGVITTAYLAARASFDAAFVIMEADSPPETTRDKVELVWHLYIPAGISGVGAIACIIASTRISARRTAGMAAAYSLSERAFSEYRTKVIEEIGAKKEETIRDKLAEDSIRNNPSDTIIIESGQVLACELYTKRYFNTNMQALKAAQNEVNAKVVNHLYVTLDEFYDILGLEHTANSDQLGWDSDKLLNLEISTVLSPDGRPCLAFAYNYVKAV